MQVYWKEWPCTIYVREPLARRNYDDIHNLLDTFACTCVLKHSDISHFMAKLVAATPDRGETSDTIQLYRHLGRPLIFQMYQTYRPAGRAIRFKLPVIIFRRLECHVLMGCIFNYPRSESRRVLLFARTPRRSFSPSFEPGFGKLKWIDARRGALFSTRHDLMA